MGWEETGVTDLLNIPDRMQMHWKFFNAFFKAFQERAYYTESGGSFVPRPAFYDDLILDGPQIHQTELRSRLNSFNQAVRINWPVINLQVPPFGKALAKQWLKVDTWDEFGTFTDALEDDLADEVFWEYAEVRALLTDDVFDSILVDYTYENNFNPAYWTGIYQLINLMEYRGLSIVTGPEPIGIEDDQRNPRLHCTGREDFTGNGPVFDDLIAESVIDSVITTQGTKTITSGEAQAFSSSHFRDGESESASVSYQGMANDPFVITPLAMDIRTKLDARIEERSVDQQIKFNTVIWDIQDTLDITNIPSTRVAITIGGVAQPLVYTPDIATFFADRIQNLNIPVSFEVLTGKNKLDRSAVPDIRLTQTVDTTPVTPVIIPPVDSITRVTKSRAQGNTYILDRAICRIPLELLEYQEQTPP